jgi:8-oxo-dGTP pyrophosphatase MutT (NUDIX family)
MISCVGAAIVGDGKLLLGLRAPHKSYAGCWDILGGHVEDGESLVGALRRELQEEANIVPIRYVFLRALTFDEAKHPATLHIFAVRGWEGALSLRGDEHTELRWFPVTEAAALENLAFRDYAEIFRGLSC